LGYVDTLRYFAFYSLGKVNFYPPRKEDQSANTLAPSEFIESTNTITSSETAFKDPISPQISQYLQNLLQYQYLQREQRKMGVFEQANEKETGSI